MVDRAEDVQLDPSMVGSKAASKSCNMFNCFDVYRFGFEKCIVYQRHQYSFVLVGVGWLEEEV